MMSKGTPEPMCTPEEVIEIMDKDGSSEEVRRVFQLIWRYKFQEEGVEKIIKRGLVETTDFTVLASDIYFMGRLQGIREERAKKHGRSSEKRQ